MRLHQAIIIFLLLLFVSCNKQPKPVPKKYTYNEKANELIIQIMSTKSEKGIMEIPFEPYSSLSEESKIIAQEDCRKLLKLNKSDNVDSILKLTDNFKWDENLLQKNNIRLIRYDTTEKGNIKNSYDRIKFEEKITKLCPQGIIAIQRPILNKKLNRAIIKTGVPFTCSSPMNWSMKLEKGKWVNDSKFQP